MMNSLCFGQNEVVVKANFLSEETLRYVLFVLCLE